MLVVDDRADNLLAVEAVLEPLALDIVRATSGEEALRHLLTQDFAVILLDVQMPELDGFETARYIKDRERTAHIPIIFLTAISREREHQLEGYGAGAVDYLAKPFEPEVLRSKVAVFVDLYLKGKLIEEQNALLADRLDEVRLAQAALGRQTVELERSNAELERFANAITHELREPLYTARGFLELLASSDAPDPELLDRGQASVERAIVLLADLLRYAGVSSADLQFEEVDLEGCIEGAITDLGAALRDSGGAIVHDPLPKVRGDEFQLRQLFVNLIGNSLRYRSAAVPEIHVSLARREDLWVLSVRDNGVGIPPEDLPRIFAMFSGLQRSDAAGSGVGLAVCRRVVERHGGTIWAEPAQTRGATISFTLPVL